VHDRRALSRLRRVPREAAHQGAELYAGDTGLALHLRGVLDADALGREPTVGVWLENLVLNDLLAWRETEIIKPGLFFRRTVTGEEVDLILERGSASCRSR